MFLYPYHGIAGGSRKSNDTWTIGSDYTFKTGKNIAGLSTHIAISKTLTKNGMDAAYPLPTKTGADFITEDERYTGDRVEVEHKYGHAIAKLHQVLKKQDHNLDANDKSLLDTVLNWALPKTKQVMAQWDCPLPEEFYHEYTNTFSQLYPNLPRHIIHRDPNPSNIMFDNGEVTGFIDFIISERNVRLLDPCYCATGILSEAGNVDGGFEKWPQILKGILTGYDKIANLTETEKQAIPYIIYSIQLIFIAWLDGSEEYKDIALQNRKMLSWLWENKEIFANLCNNA